MSAVSATQAGSAALRALVRATDRVTNKLVHEAGVIEWGSPIPAFGNPSSSRVATVGINPSSREFVDELGQELVGSARRFHTLSSLGIRRWEDADAGHLGLMLDSAWSYFRRNPYNTWFSRLDYVLAGLDCSLYGSRATACHIDLVPFATVEKWARLPQQNRNELLKASRDVAGGLLRECPIELVILNGRTVVSSFERLAGVELKRRAIPTWTLSRAPSSKVIGVAFAGTIGNFGGVRLDREVVVLGFNHNLQSSFGMTTAVLRSIRDWIRRAAFRMNSYASA